MTNGNDTSIIRIPGLTFGGAIQLSNTTVIMTVLGAIAVSVIGMHTLTKGKKEWKRRNNRRGMRTGVLQNKVLHDVISYSADATQVGRNLPQIKNVVRSLQGRIQDLKRSFYRGEITKAAFDVEIGSMYQQVLTELNIPPNTVPIHLVNQYNAKIERLADKVEEGRLPTKLNFRLYKNHPDLNAFYVAGRNRAVQRNATANVLGWEREGFPGQGKAWGHRRDDPLFPGAGSHYAGWMRQ